MSDRELENQIWKKFNKQKAPNTRDTHVLYCELCIKY